MSHVGQSVLRGDVRYGLTTQGNQFFYGFGGFHSIEEQALAIGLWSLELVIGKIDKTKLTNTAADWPARQRKGRGGRVPSTPPTVEIPL